MSTEATTFARQMIGRAAHYLTSTTRGIQDPLGHLETLRHAEWLLKSAQALLIEAARSEGATWADIARARGTSRQAERQASQQREAASLTEPFDQWLKAYRDRLRREQMRRVRPARHRRTGTN